MADVLTIAGATKTLQIESLQISKAINERSTFSGRVASLDGTYRPARFAELIFARNSVKLFGGNIDPAPTEEGHQTTKGVPISSAVVASAFEALADRRLVTIVIPAGTLKSFAEALEPYLTPYGVSLDVSQVDGPDLPEMEFNGERLTSVFDKIVVATGFAYFWRIDADKVYGFYLSGDVAAPFDVATGDRWVIGDIKVKPSTQKYANRFTVYAGTGTKDVEDHLVFDGIEDTFPLTYNPNAFYGGVTVNSTVFETLGTGATWEYDEGTNSITRTDGPPPAGTGVITYVGQFPYRAVADDVGEQAGGANLQEDAIAIPEEFNATVANTLAAGYLARSVSKPRIVEYVTRRDGLEPGMLQTVTVPERNLNGVSCLITNVDITSVGHRILEYKITAITGLIPSPSPNETYRQWMGGSGTSSGGVVVIESPGGGAAAPRYAQTVIVAKSGGDYNTIQAAIDSITDAATTKRYLVWVMPGKYEEQITMAEWVDVMGVSKHAVQVAYGATDGAIKLANSVQLSGLLIENSATEGHWGIVGDNVSRWHIRDVDCLAPLESSRRGAGIKVTGSSWSTGFIERCVINTYSETNQGIRLESDGADLADVTINDCFVDSFEATTGGSVLLNNIIDTQIRNLHARTSASGYDLRVTGTSQVELVGGILEFGADSLEVDTGAVVTINFCSIDTISGAGSWNGVRQDRDSENLQVLSGGIVGAILRGNGLIESLAQSGTPTTPPTNRGARYLRADRKPRFMDDQGVELSSWDTGVRAALVAPVNATFGTWVNQGSSTISDQTDSLVLLGAATGSGANIVARVGTAPATPWTLTAYLLPCLNMRSFLGYGLCYRQSSDGKLDVFGVFGGSSGSILNIRRAKYTNATTFSADYQSTGIGWPVRWLRIADNGTNRIVSISADGTQWLVIHTIGRTDFLTANQFGFFVSTENSATPNFDNPLRVQSLVVG